MRKPRQLAPHALPHGLAALLLLGCSGSSGPPAVEAPPRREKPPSLAKPELFPAEYREAAREVGAYLAMQGESADQFYAEVDKKEKALVFHLWHESAFLPENRNTAGNPGGKCRDVWYDPAKHRVIKILGWQ